MTDVNTNQPGGNDTAAGNQPSVASAFHNTVGTRSLADSEMQALYARLEANGTPIEEVNKIIAAQGGAELAEDDRDDAERRFDEKYQAGETADQYSIHLRGIDAPEKVQDEIRSHAQAFAHALELPKAGANELMGQMVSTAIETAKLAQSNPDALAAQIERSRAILIRALGGPAKLEAAIADLQTLLNEAGVNADFAAKIDAALTDPQVFLALHQHIERITFRARRDIAKGRVTA